MRRIQIALFFVFFLLVLSSFRVWAQTPTITFTPLVRYNDQYNGSGGLPNNGRHTFGDTFVMAWAQDGTVYVSVNDGYGFSTNQCNGTTGENMLFAKYIGSGYLNGSNVNCMINFCAFNTTNCPAPWSDNNTWKTAGMLQITDINHANTIYWWVYRQSGSVPFGGANAFLIKSVNNGVSWCAPVHSNGIETCSITPVVDGDVPAPSDTPTMSGTKMVRPSFVQYGKGGNTSLNVDGNPTYIYTWIQDSALINFYLGRCARSTDCTQAATWEYFTGIVGADPTVGANWSSSTTSATVMYSVAGTTVQGAPKYVVGVGYLWAVTGIYAPFDLTILQATRLTGPWTILNVGGLAGSDAIRPNFPMIDISTAGTFFPNTISVLSSGDYTVQTSDPATNNYSEFYLTFTLQQAGAAGSSVGAAITQH